MIILCCILDTMLQTCYASLRMNRVWEQSTVEPRNARWSGMYVTMTKTGVIFLSAKVIKALEGSERYLLLYDRTNNSIGLQPTNSMTPHSRKAGVKGKKG